MQNFSSSSDVKDSTLFVLPEYFKTNSTQKIENNPNPGETSQNTDTSKTDEGNSQTDASPTHAHELSVEKSVITKNAPILSVGLILISLSAFIIGFRKQKKDGN